MRPLIIILTFALCPSLAVAAIACDKCNAPSAGYRCYRMQSSGPVYHTCPPVAPPPSPKGGK